MAAQTESVVQKAYNAKITLALDYKASATSKVKRIYISSERITYLMIEKKYENVNILPVIYLSLSLSSDNYTKVVKSSKYSQFYLKVEKKNILSETAVYKKIFEDQFTYVTSTTDANYSKKLDENNDDAYKSIMIGLVSATMTNQLRTSYNGIYKNIDTKGLVGLALKDLKNVVKKEIEYDTNYGSYIIPPVTSRFKLLQHIFEKDPFYSSNFTFFMDFKYTYLLSKNGEAVKNKKKNTPLTVLIKIKNYTAEEAYIDGFTIKNNSYLLYCNAMDTKVVVNNSTSKVANNITAYNDDSSTNGTQNLSIDNNTNESISTKKMYVRSKDAAAMKNELDSNSIVIELTKQNLDNEIFTPNKCYKVTNYKDYKKYDGRYYLYYTKEFFYPTSSEQFILTCNIGLKKVTTEEETRFKKTNKKVDSYSIKKAKSYAKKKKTSNMKSILSSTKKSSS